MGGYLQWESSRALGWSSTNRPHMDVYTGMIARLLYVVIEGVMGH